MRILLDEEIQGGGGQTTTVVAPVVKSTASNMVPHPSKAPPERISKMEFKDDFDPLKDHVVEQLPAQNEKKDDKKVETKVKPKTEVVVEVKTGEADTNEIQSKEEKVEVQPKEEKTGFSKFLKAPKSKVEEQQTGKVQDKQGTVGRDYSGFTESETSALKQMSNAGFELAAKALKDNKELAKLKDSTYLQHDQAFVLDPNYQKLHSDSTYIRKEFDYWQQQLANMDKGEKWQPIKGWDKNGNPVLDKERDPSKGDEEQVRMLMQKCYNMQTDVQGQIDQYPSKYKSQVSTDMQKSNAERTNRFPWVKDSSLMEHTINVEGLGERSIKQVYDDIKGLFPSYMQKHPAMDWVADLYVSFMVQQAEISELRTGKQVDTVRQDEKSLVEPTSGQRKVEVKEKKAVHGIKEFSAPPGF